MYRSGSPTTPSFSMNSEGSNHYWPPLQERNCNSNPKERGHRHSSSRECNEKVLYKGRYQHHHRRHSSSASSCSSSSSRSKSNSDLLREKQATGPTKSSNMKNSKPTKPYSRSLATGTPIPRISMFNRTREHLTGLKASPPSKGSVYNYESVDWHGIQIPSLPSIVISSLNMVRHRDRSDGDRRREEQWGDSEEEEEFERSSGVDVRRRSRRRRELSGFEEKN